MKCRIDNPHWNDYIKGMEKEIKSMSPDFPLRIRPFCKCCGGGSLRGRVGKYSHTKAVSRRNNIKSRRAKPKYKDH